MDPGGIERESPGGLRTLSYESFDPGTNDGIDPLRVGRCSSGPFLSRGVERLRDPSAKPVERVRLDPEADYEDPGSVGGVRLHALTVARGCHRAVTALPVPRVGSAQAIDEGAKIVGGLQPHLVLQELGEGRVLVDGCGDVVLCEVSLDQRLTGALAQRLA